jgi:peptidoglycan-associated lipoprotein
MKLTQFSNLTLFTLTLSLLTLGCRSKSGYITKLPDSSAPAAHTTETTPGKPATDDDNKVKSDNLAGNALSDPDLRKDWPRDREIFKSDTVHFDLDSSAIRNEEKPKLAAVAEYIKAHGSDALEIDGHCDQRGTEEYNRALGERRALALREELVRLGVEASRVDTVSFGEDRPVDPAHNDAAYAKNRRGEFVLEKHPTLVGLNSPPIKTSSE